MYLRESVCTLVVRCVRIAKEAPTEVPSHDLDLWNQGWPGVALSTRGQAGELYIAASKMLLPVLQMVGHKELSR
jgi:hypothetical protein